METGTLKVETVRANMETGKEKMETTATKIATGKEEMETSTANTARAGAIHSNKVAKIADMSGISVNWELAHATHLAFSARMGYTPTYSSRA